MPPNLSSMGAANVRETSAAPSDRTFTTKPPLCRIARNDPHERSTQTSSCGGASETLAIALQGSPRGSPRSSSAGTPPPPGGDDDITPRKVVSSAMPARSLLMPSSGSAAVARHRDGGALDRRAPLDALEGAGRDHPYDVAGAVRAHVPRLSPIAQHDRRPLDDQLALVAQ